MLLHFLVIALLVLTVRAHTILLAHRSIPSAQRVKRSTPDNDLEPGVYVLQFKQRIDAGGLRRIANILGYEPHDYVPKNGLLLYVNGSTQALALQAALESRMARLFKLIASDRQANIGGALHRIASRRSTDRFVIYRNQSRNGQPVRHDVPKDPLMVTLRAHVLGGVGDVVDMTSRSIEVVDIEKYAAAVSRTKPSAHYVVNTDMFIVHNVHRDDAAAVADELVRRFANIAWIELRQPYRLMNKWSVPAIERLSENVEARGAKWKPLGTGVGQLVSMSDTGISTTQCFFTDGLGARAGNVPRTASTTAVPPDTGHPKFRAYTSGVGGDFDDANGHGTHTAGTLVGRAKADSQSAAFNGVATDARLCFYDLLGVDGEAALSVPDDIGTIFTWSAICGAFIHSGSWGAENFGTYTADERAVDLFTWNNRHFLPIFAAGNTGPSKNSVGSPGCAKNVLTIGAVMNGIDALQMAVKRAPFEEAVYSNRRVGDFSSRGDFDAQSAAKVDLVADGGSYVWSAAFDAPKSGTCDTGETVLGLEGTSMATPAAAGAAVLVREWLLKYGGLESMPTASLMRSMLIGSAQPTDGAYPGTQPYATYADRRNAEGFGRIALDQVLHNSLRIVSNERGQLGLARAGDAVRLCVSIEGQSPLNGALSDGTELVIVLSYVDYPSAIGLAKADLVNDLDLVVRTANNATPQSVNGLEPGVREVMSTNERVVLRTPRAVDIAVVASTIDFGGPQTFSLIVLLRGPNAANYKLILSTPQLLHGETQSPCSLCGATQFVARGDCVVCGDGVVTAPIEQCEPSLSGAECCDGGSCRWMTNNALCGTTMGACRVQGRCTRDNPRASNSTMTCTPSNTLNYVMKRSISSNGGGGGVTTFCESTAVITEQSPPTPLLPNDSSPAIACAHTVAFWVDQLRNNASSYTSDDDRLCCARFSAFAEVRTPPEPLYHQLALEFIATRLNAESGVTSDQLIALRAAQLLLEKQCAAVGFTDNTDRDDALDLIHRLQTLALPVCTDEPTIPADVCTPPTRGTEVSELLCNGAPNRYIDAERRCACGALFHAGEPDCRDLACSGNGASIYDYQTRQPACVCLPGWSGTTCQRCADSVDGARWMCIGVPQSLVVGQHTHVLQMVVTSSVTSRLSGLFYASNVDKQQDSLPGVAPLDCACRQIVDRILPSAFETHIETFEASVDERIEQAILWAHAQPLLEARSSSTTKCDAAEAFVAHAQKQANSARSTRTSSQSALRMQMSLLGALLLFRLFE